MGDIHEFPLPALEWGVVPLRDAGRGARGLQDKAHLFPRLGCEVLMPLSFAPNGPALTVLWLIILVDASMQIALAPQFSWRLLLDSTFPVACNLNQSLVKMPQRRKDFFTLFPFFPLSRLDFVQLHCKRSQLCKQVQILAQFLFIYSPSYFSNCCQVKTLFN